MFRFLIKNFFWEARVWVPIPVQWYESTPGFSVVFSVFLYQLSVIWLPQDQLWDTDHEARVPKYGGSQSPVYCITGAWIGALPITTAMCYTTVLLSTLLIAEVRKTY